jgi:hypothetical protein
MGIVVNLKSARKARQRAQAADQAAVNRQRFGQTREQRAAERAAAAEHQRQSRQLAGLSLGEVDSKTDPAG